MAGVRLDARPWQPASGLADMARFDIGLVPLHDSSFEQAKFPFKLLQYRIEAKAGVGTDAKLQNV